MTSDELVELESLRREMNLHSLGDRPSSMAAEKLARLIELECLEVASKTVVTDSTITFKALELCWEIEKLPASELQTKLNLMANDLHRLLLNRAISGEYNL